MTIVKDNLGKLTLAGVLIATLVLAVLVQQYKLAEIRIELDRQVVIPSPFGQIELRVNSAWREVPESKLPSEVLAGWVAPNPAGRGPVELYVSSHEGGYSLRSDAAMRALSIYSTDLGQLRRFETDDSLEPLHGYHRLTASAIFGQSQDRKSVV